MYTLDQCAYMLGIDSLQQFKTNYIHFDGKHVGPRPPGKILARSISIDVKPEWRVAEAELVRWLRYKGFRLYDKNWVTSR